MKALTQTPEVCVLLLIAFSQPLFAENPPVAPPAGNLSPADSAGRKIFIDPVTGRKGAPPRTGAAPAVPPGLTNRVGHASERLPEIPVKTKPGGFKVHLDDRFQTTLTATNKLNGKPSVRRYSDIEQMAPNASTASPAPPLNGSKKSFNP